MLGAAVATDFPFAAAPAGGSDLIEEGPDAEMVRLCGSYVELCKEYNTAHYTEAALASVHVRLEAVEAQIEDLPPKTLAGVTAKARMATALATQEPDGDGGWNSGPAGSWARDVVRDLVRLSGANGAA